MPGKTLKFKLASRVFALYLAALFGRKRKVDALRTELCGLISTITGTTFTAQAISLELAGSVSMQGVCIAYANRINISIAHVSIKLSMPALLKRRVQVISLKVDDMICSASSPASDQSAGPAPSNGVGKRENRTSLSGLKRYYRLAFRMLNRLFHYWPQHVTLNNINVMAVARGKQRSLSLTSFRAVNGTYEAALQSSFTGSATHTLKGRISQQDKLISIDEITTPGRSIGIHKDEKFGLSIRKLAAFELEINCTAGNCEIFNQRLSKDKVFVDCFEARVFCSLKDTAFSIDKRSELRWNFLRCHFQLNHLFADESLRANVSFPQSEPADFLRSFPGFTCKDIYGMDYKGKLSFEMNLLFFFKDPTKYVIKASMLKDQFCVGQLDDAVFASLKGPFVHPVYKDERLLKQIELAANKNGFVPFRDMPSLLHKIIIETEDPNFFTHRGVDPYFMMNALVQNVQRARIERGGSTITMQLARNLFLGHNRNFLRKIEEVVIAWLIEDTFRLPKERILEIYFNIIEFAPGVYGITDASRYYFAKLPKELSLTECIVLAYIIPRPKHFDEALDLSSEKLNRNLKEHIHRVSQLMLSKGIINRTDLGKISFRIPIKNKVLQLS